MLSISLTGQLVMPQLEYQVGSFIILKAPYPTSQPSHLEKSYSDPHYNGFRILCSIEL